MKNNGVIYILTNPSFPEYVKIGYADDIDVRLRQLNRSECIPYAFRLYAYYKVESRLTDLKLHNLIDRLNPELRSIEDFNGKKRVREFFAMTAEEAYEILSAIAEINGLECNLVKVPLTESEEKDIVESNYNRSINRHHFKEVVFSSSLTGKTYRTSTNEEGTLSIYDNMTGEEIPNRSNPSKNNIARVALSDLGEVNTDKLTLYQCIHRITKILNQDNKKM